MLVTFLFKRCVFSHVVSVWLAFKQLLARIERMERRLQLLSKEPRDKRLFQPLERWVPDTEDFWESDLGDSPQTQASKSGGKVPKR